MQCYEHPEVEAVGACTNCGRAVCSSCSMEVGGRLMCKPCTEKLAAQCITAQAAPKKEPALALLLSLAGGLVSGLFIGLGQIYNGQVKKGIILSALHFFVVMTIFILMFVLIGFCLLPLPLILWVYAIYDAYVTADKINRGEPVKDWLD